MKSLYKGGYDETTKPHIRSRPFCPGQCLLVLALGKDADESCPNAECHGQKHTDRLEFVHVIREQLALDRGHDADCMPLQRSGSRGSLFKLRLSTHSYTLVAKGMQGLDLDHLQHENEIHDRLLAILGKCVPVCLGSIDLILPYYNDCGVYKHFLFLGRAERPIFEYKNQINNLNMTNAITRERQASVSRKDRQARKKHRGLQKQHKLHVDMDREAEMMKQGMISRLIHQPFSSAGIIHLRTCIRSMKNAECM